MTSMLNIGTYSTILMCTGYVTVPCCSSFIPWDQKKIRFSKEKDRPLRELSDPLWLADLTFLVDFAGHLTTLNKSLKGKDQLVPQLYAHMKAFCVKLCLFFKTQLRNFSVANYPALSEIKSAFPKAILPAEKRKFVSVITSLMTEFNQRSQDFFAIETDIKLFSTCFLVDAEEVDEKLQLELIKMQCEDSKESTSASLLISAGAWKRPTFLWWGTMKKEWWVCSAQHVYVSKRFLW